MKPYGNCVLPFALVVLGAAPLLAQSAAAPPDAAPSIAQPVGAKPGADNVGKDKVDKKAKPDPKHPAAKSAAQAASNTPPSDATEQPYVIGPLDVLEIQVWKNPELTGTYPVRPDGMISMPLIGEFKADGLTVPGLKDVVKKKVSEFMEEPEVNVQPVRYNSRKIYILGGCNRQGEMPLIGNMRILDAISNCGGFRDFANLKGIYVLRENKRFKFNYKEVSQGKNMEQNIFLENGDHIFVPEK